MCIASELLFHELLPGFDMTASYSTSDILYKASAERLMALG